MARNYEKNFGRLNRLWLDKGTSAKREKRPKLSSLKTSEEISQWLPSIKNDLDFYLKQMEVPCYTEQKVAECRKHIHYLEAEYKAFVRKLHQSNTELKATPWTARPYEKKLKGSQDFLSLHPLGAQSPVTFLNILPVSMHDELYQEDTSSKDDLLLDMEEITQTQISSCGSGDLPLFPEDASKEPLGPKCNEGETSTSTDQKPLRPEGHTRKQNPLGLNYSSSDDDDNT